MGKRSRDDWVDGENGGLSKRGRTSDYTMITAPTDSSIPTPPTTPINSKKRQYVETEDDNISQNDRVIKRLRTRPIIKSASNIVLDAVVRGVMEGLESHDIPMTPEQSNNVREEPALSSIDRYHALYQTQYQITLATNGMDNPVNRLQSICNALQDLITAAKMSGCCWHLTRLEKEEFTRVAGCMETLVLGMSEEEKCRVDERILKEIDVGFATELDLRGVLGFVRGYFGSMNVREGHVPDFNVDVGM